MNIKQYSEKRELWVLSYEESLGTKFQLPSNQPKHSHIHRTEIRYPEILYVLSTVRAFRRCIKKVTCMRAFMRAIQTHIHTYGQFRYTTQISELWEMR